MSTVLVYRRALQRFATCIVFTILNIAVCTLMVHWSTEREVSSLLLLLSVPLALTLGNMWRCAVKDLVFIDAAVSPTRTGTADRAPAQV